MSTTISGTNGVTFPDSTSMQTGQQACKAWVNFNGTGTVAIGESYNVSSITDNGTGQYAVNFTTAMPDANYSGVCFSKAVNPYISSLATGSFVVITANTAGTLVDTDTNCVAIFSN